MTKAKPKKKTWSLARFKHPLYPEFIVRVGEFQAGGMLHVFRQIDGKQTSRSLKCRRRNLGSTKEVQETQARRLACEYIEVLVNPASVVRGGSMRSHVFLTPMSPSGKPGEVIEIQYNDEPVKYLEPVSPFAEQALPDAATTELETERDALIASLPKLKGGARAKVEHRIRVLEREITAARSVEESERRKTEREKERQRQQVGADSPFSRNDATLEQLRAMVASAVAGVAGVKRAKMSWAEYLADLDARLAKRALEALRRGEITAPVRPAAGPAGHASTVCCEGQYKCERCRAA